MKNLPMTSTRRNRERGAVAIMIAFMWTALFGMAVMAVDFGYLYTKRARAAVGGRRGGDRGDADLQWPGLHRARTRAAIRGGRRERVHRAASIDHVAVGNQFDACTIPTTYPTFFGGIFGMSLEEHHRPRRADRLTGATPGSGDLRERRAACCGPVDLGLRRQRHGRRAAHRQRRRRSPEQDRHRSRRSDLQRNDLQGHRHGAQPLHRLQRRRGRVSCASPAARSAARAPDPLAANTLATLDAFCTVGTTHHDRAAAPSAWGPGCGGCNPIPTGVYCSSDNHRRRPRSGSSRSARPSSRSSRRARSASPATAASRSPAVRRFRTGIIAFANGLRPGRGSGPRSS